MLEGVWLVHPDDAMCEAFRERFAGLPNVRVVKGRFEDLEPHDCFVTAGNAFGLMTAGIDAAVVRRFGEPLMAAGSAPHHGPVLRRSSLSAPRSCCRPRTRPLPFLCHAPTMRVPGNIEGTDKVYAATWAALLVGARRTTAAPQRIEVVALPAMGTGFGGVPFEEAARQMAAAYRHLLEPPHRLDWDFVVERHKAVCYDGGRQVAR